MYPLKTKAPYEPSTLSKTWNIFTTVYMGNYVTGDFREGGGSHPGVDIMPQVKHDNIYACLDGVVHFAGTTDSNGNYIVLKHAGAPDPSNLSSTTTLFSCHLHLSSLSVKTGDAVKEGDVIGQTGNTGNSTGEHLHFQIDTGDAPFHPYWPFTWKDSQSAGLGFFESVNSGLGIDNARKYTVNPLVYLDKVSANKGHAPIVNPKIETPAFATKSKYFSDVSEDIEEIDYLASTGVTKGYGDGTFRPMSNISRVELLSMVLTFAKVPLDANATCSFTDVSTSDWSCKFVASATAKGIVKGYPDNTFKPNNPVTRAEGIKMTLNAIIGENNIAIPSDSEYQDINVSDWYCKYANYVAENGLLDNVGKFFPNDNLKRRDLAVILYNLKK